MRMKKRIKDNWGLNMKYLQIRYFGFFFIVRTENLRAPPGQFYTTKAGLRSVITHVLISHWQLGVRWTRHYIINLFLSF